MYCSNDDGDLSTNFSNDDDDLCTAQVMMVIPFLIIKSSDHIVKIIFLEEHGNGH